VEFKAYRAWLSIYNYVGQQGMNSKDKLFTCKILRATIAGLLLLLLLLELKPCRPECSEIHGSGPKSS
jgi:hypothetical protein